MPINVPINGPRINLFNSKMDRLEEEGIFSPAKRSMTPGTRYLIVSYGGTGADALFKIKDTFEKNLPDNEYNERVRLLEIDTAADTIYQNKKIVNPNGTVTVVQVDQLTPEQFHHLDNTNAVNDVAGEQGQYDSWVNPDFFNNVKANPGNYMDGNGAGGTRQIGRMLLMPSSTVQGLQAKITGLWSQLTNGNNDQVKVFVVSGISGGTGSGTVIDLTYLIKYIISQLPLSANKNVEFAGFMLLPPTGNSQNATDISKGNRNGYACLKEIEHFMTLTERNDNYQATIGGLNINSNAFIEKNIFKTCYVIDGIRGQVAVTNPREAANSVLAECLLDMITSQPVVNNGPQMVDSFLIDVRAYVQAMVSGKAATIAPRDANYIYCALGHSETKIPMELIKAYIANKIYNGAYRHLLNCNNVNNNIARDFVRSVTVRPFSERAQRDRILQEINIIFNDIDKGPFYTINLLAESISEVERLKRKIHLGGDKQYDYMIWLFGRLNDETFNVYTMVMDRMKDILSNEADIQTYTKTVVNANGSRTYTFQPIDLSAKNAQTQEIYNYLDGLVNANMKQITANLLTEMAANREKWTQIYNNQGNPGAFSPEIEISKFWNDQINKILNASLEDFLIKFYSGNKDAYFDPNNPNAPMTVQALTTAAQTIYDQMFGPAGSAIPMVELTNSGLQPTDFNCHKFMLIPESAPHLQQYIQKYINGLANPNKPVLYSSYANDRISCYTQYTNIPAFKLAWVSRAEKDYETAIQAANQGLHISESLTGKHWAEFSNLLPRDSWRNLPDTTYVNKRELKFADAADKVLNMAAAMGLAVPLPLAVGAAGTKYELHYLDTALIPDAKLYREADNQLNPNSKAVLDEKIKACADALYRRKQDWLNDDADNLMPSVNACFGNPVFSSRELVFANSVVSAGPNVTPADNWYLDVAACNLRRLPELLYVARGTMDVMAELQRLVKEEQEKASYLETFARYLAADLFTYNEALDQWTYTDAKGYDMCLADLEANIIKKTAQYYYMFKGFEAQYVSITKNLTDAYNNVRTDNDPALKLQKTRNFMAKAAALEQTVKNCINDRTNPNPLTMVGTMQFERLAAQNGEDVAAIRSFYTNLQDTLNNISLVG